ncbi:hypothetical protein AGMMS50293_08330 [Spirochaetia bacterium]|nr:hypothetical protein AGMMS50293_08330 [Spirochaetia bacterium]
MQESFSLNELYVQYTQGRLMQKDLEGSIFKTILEDPRRFGLYHWREEERADFASWIYPRIRSAISSYRENGSSFENYLGSAIRWGAKEYRSNIADNGVAEYAAWTVRIPDLYTREVEPEYMADEPEVSAEDPQPLIVVDCLEQSIARIKKNPRQLMMLILKCYCYVSDDFLDRIAEKTGIEKEKIKQCVDKLRAVRIKQDEKLRTMRERIYCQFYRCIIYERRLAVMEKNSTIALRMERRLDKARIRLAAMRKRFAGIRPVATNRQVADILGITKGTVDSSLHNLKSRWKNMLDECILN